MDADSFFTRWARRKAEASPAAPAPAAADIEAPVAEQAPVELTLDDVAKLTPESDYTPFVARGVDENVKRSALKKLFSDPQFNVMDGLDTYIDDYNKFEPIPPEMLAALNHAKALLNPIAFSDSPLMRLAREELQPDANALAASASQENPDASEPENSGDAAPVTLIETTSNQPDDDHTI